jgi:hypothetical protein
MVLNVQAIDAFGNYLVEGGDHFVVLVAGPGVITPVTVDNGDGTYKSSVFAREAGNYTAIAYLNGVQIAGSPCTLVIETCNRLLN